MSQASHPTPAPAVLLAALAVLAATASLPAFGSDDLLAERKTALERGAAFS